MISALSANQADVVTEACKAYQRDGFWITPPLLDDADLSNAVAVMDRIVAGDYLTGVAPNAVHWKPGDDPAAIVKIDDPQRSDPAVTELVSQPAIGEWAAALTGAEMVQVWAIQLLRKPPGGAAGANVGWHQDDDYWSEWWDGEVFTCWLALSDVTLEAGPMSFVPGSHRWGFIGAGNFFDQDLDGRRGGMKLPEGAGWSEVAAVLPPGAASFHNRLTMHGSGPNTTSGYRRSYAIHLRTEKSRLKEGAPSYYRETLGDPALSPIIFGG
ncbi:MAG: phytanoyl-CoA dioxygenase family protein [Candidatus Dormibacteria bacterium]